MTTPKQNLDKIVEGSKTTAKGLGRIGLGGLGLVDNGKELTEPFSTNTAILAGLTATGLWGLTEIGSHPSVVELGTVPNYAIVGGLGALGGIELYKLLQSDGISRPLTRLSKKIEQNRPAAWATFAAGLLAYNISAHPLQMPRVDVSDGFTNPSVQLVPDFISKDDARPSNLSFDDTPQRTSRLRTMPADVANLKYTPAAGYDLEDIVLPSGEESVWQIAKTYEPVIEVAINRYAPNSGLTPEIVQGMIAQESANKRWVSDLNLGDGGLIHFTRKTAEENAGLNTFGSGTPNYRDSTHGQELRDLYDFCEGKIGCMYERSGDDRFHPVRVIDGTVRHLADLMHAAGTSDPFVAVRRFHSWNERHQDMYEVAIREQIEMLNDPGVAERARHRFAANGGDLDTYFSETVPSHLAQWGFDAYRADN